MSKNSVVAITVTYNRSNTLERTIKSLINQSYEELNNIIIVDNNSNDENKEKIKKIQKLDNRIEVLYLNENLGGAGGFSYGMEYVKNNIKAEWYWIMDDDAYPTKECLKNLIKKSSLDNVGFLAPMIWGVGKNEYQLYHHKKLSKSMIMDKKCFSSIDEVPEYSEVEANAFVGPLINASIIKEVGIVDPDLFIYGDDTEYTYRITRRFKGYLIKDAIIEHEDIFAPDNIIEKSSWWKQYYKYRNRYLLINKYSKSNFLRISNRCLLTVYIFLIIFKQMIKKYDTSTKKIIIKTLFLSIKDGWKNENGKKIDPRKFLIMMESKNV